MTVSQLASRVLTERNLVGAAVVIATVLVSVWGVTKVPAQVGAIQQTLEQHSQQTGVTNRKLDVLICLQAKLDTPIRCVAKEAKPN